MKKIQIVAATLVFSCLFSSRQISASPLVPAGDAILRQDIQMLADHGILAGPVTTWPLAWGPILADLRQHRPLDGMPAPIVAAMHRVEARAGMETRTKDLMFSAHASAADSPTRIRGFSNTPRESWEVGGGISWIGDRLSIDLRGQLVAPDTGNTKRRVDGSMIGLALGNYALSLGFLDRWWGPGWDGSLVLSNNARPIPAISIDRNFTDPFDSRWLRWLGHWDVSIMMGQLEADRVIPNALFFGMRFNFKPLPNLEIGLSRTAQWCGDGRPCDAGTFGDLLIGHDNIGDAGIGADNEPGNQLAGVDFRWSQANWGIPSALYGQIIGEDEAGGFPSRYLGLFGLEYSGVWRGHWSWRWFGEFAGTTCQFHESSEIFNCAYNHGIYRTGYRFRGRAIGHGADNDARIYSTGVDLADENGSEWHILLRSGTLNRGGSPDTRNSLTAIPQEIRSLDVSHSRPIRYGVVRFGVGYEDTESAGAQSDHDTRLYFDWRSSY